MADTPEPNRGDPDAQPHYTPQVKAAAVLLLKTACDHELGMIVPMVKEEGGRLSAVLAVVPGPHAESAMKWIELFMRASSAGIDMGPYAEHLINGMEAVRSGRPAPEMPTGLKDLMYGDLPKGAADGR